MVCNIFFKQIRELSDSLSDLKDEGKPEILQHLQINGRGVGIVTSNDRVGVAVVIRLRRVFVTLWSFDKGDKDRLEATRRWILVVVASVISGYLLLQLGSVYFSRESPTFGRDARFVWRNWRGHPTAQRVLFRCCREKRGGCGSAGCSGPPRGPASRSRRLLEKTREKTPRCSATPNFDLYSSKRKWQTRKYKKRKQ